MKKFSFLLFFSSCLFFSNLFFSDLKKDTSKFDPEIKYVIFDVNGSFWRPKTSDILSSYSKKHRISFLNKIKLGGYFLAHKMGTINFRSAYNAFLSNSKGMTKKDIQKGCDALWEELCKNNIYEKAVEVFKNCKSKNIKTIIASSSISEMYKKLLEVYEFDYTCVSQIKYKKNKMSGKLIGRPCAGEDKVFLVKNLIEKKLGGTLNQVVFYFNSHRDLPLAKLVKKAIAFNPDKKLEIYAKQHNMQIIKTDKVQKASKI